VHKIIPHIIELIHSKIKFDKVEKYNIVYMSTKSLKLYILLKLVGGRN